MYAGCGKKKKKKQTNTSCELRKNSIAAMCALLLLPSIN
jgi:hypothetical protein